MQTYKVEYEAIGDFRWRFFTADDYEDAACYYNTVYHAKKRLSKCIEAGNEITMVSMDGCYHLKPEDIFLDFNND